MQPAPSRPPIDPTMLAMLNPHTAPFDLADRDLFDRTLRSFVPPGAFDVHAHLYDLSAIFPGATPADLGSRPEVDYRCFQARMNLWMGDRAPQDGLFFPFPKKQVATETSNRFLVDQLVHAPGSRGLMMITPQDDPQQVDAFIRSHHLAGFKVYHVYADQPDTFSADPGGFIPSWAWELADQRGLCITLHLVRPKALADEQNQRYLREYCPRYPNARLILAHAARGFCGHHTAEGIDALRGLDNVFFDTSAVCEPMAFEAILRTFGTTRLMYGSDFGISELSGKSVSMGDGFCWLYDHNTDFAGWAHGRLTRIGLESLLALQQACRTMHLTDGDVERLFSTNARALLEITPPPDGAGVQARYRQAKAIIPGGTQLLSKRPEMFAPDQWPAYYQQAIGCQIVDTDGRAFIDMSSGGILSTVLGYSDPDVNAAVMRRVMLGSMSTLQTDDEVQAAELLLQIHPWAHMARFTRGGGEAMAVAVRVARAATGKDGVAICGYHGWHDWYLAANRAPDTGPERLAGHLLPGLEPHGVPRGLTGSCHPFAYNRLDQLDALLARHGQTLGAVVMETTRSVDPEPGFLEGVRERADRYGLVLIFDEITIGWRLCLGGAHLKFGVVPDLAVFAKAISNGFAMGAVIGQAATMQAAEHSFISSTYWTEGIGPAATVATLRKLMRVDVPAHLRRIGSLVQEGWRTLAQKHALPLRAGGRPELALLVIDHPDAAAMATFITARMLERGFLAGTSFNAMLSHEPRHVAAYLAALEEVFGLLANAMAQGTLWQQLGGPVKHTGFARLTS